MGEEDSTILGGLYTEADIPHVGRGRKMTKAERAKTALQSADVMVGLANYVAIGITHSFEAGTTDEERRMIVKPLAQIIAESDAIAKTAGVANPVSLALGVGFWGFRVYQIWRRDHPPKPKAQNTPARGKFTPAPQSAARPEAPLAASPAEQSIPINPNTVPVGENGKPRDSRGWLGHEMGLS